MGPSSSTWKRVKDRARERTNPTQAAAFLSSPRTVLWKRAGMVPKMSPAKRVMVGPEETVSRYSTTRARRINPTSPPPIRGRKRRRCRRKVGRGWVNSWIIGSYSPKARQSTPPLTPGRMAPVPMIIPWSSRSHIRVVGL